MGLHQRGYELPGGASSGRGEDAQVRRVGEGKGRRFDVFMVEVCEKGKEYQESM